MSNKYNFKIKSAAQFEAAKAYFSALGLENQFNNYTYERLVRFGYLYFVIDFNKNLFFGCDSNETLLKNSKRITFHLALSLSVPVITVKLNENYNAEVSKTGIKVGCQNFNLDIIDALVEARDKVNKL